MLLSVSEDLSTVSPAQPTTSQKEEDILEPEEDAFTKEEKQELNELLNELIVHAAAAHEKQKVQQDQPHEQAAAPVAVLIEEV